MSLFDTALVVGVLAHGAAMIYVVHYFFHREQEAPQRRKGEVAA